MISVDPVALAKGTCVLLRCLTNNAHKHRKKEDQVEEEEDERYAKPKKKMASLHDVVAEDKQISRKAAVDREVIEQQRLKKA